MIIFQKWIYDEHMKLSVVVLIVTNFFQICYCTHFSGLCFESFKKSQTDGDARFFKIIVLENFLGAESVRRFFAGFSKILCISKNKVYHIDLSFGPSLC